MKTPKTFFNIGRIYLEGKLTAQDLVEADASFRLALNHGIPEAKTKLDEAEAKMSPEQIKTAETRYQTLEKDFQRGLEDLRSREESEQYMQKYKPW